MARNVVVLVTREGLGTVGPDDAEFGRDMLEKFLHTLEARDDRPRAICFYTDGVKLAVRGSRLVPALQLIEGLGVRLVSCATCLAHFGLEGQLAVGDVGGMKDIVELMMTADSVVTV